MKISSILASLSIFAISPSYACLHTYGQIHVPLFGGDWSLVWAGVTDNGLDVCDTAWGAARTDNDGHWTLNCLPGYIYAVSKDGTTAWYSNGVNAYSFAQSTSYVSGTVYDYTWQTYNFGC